MTVQLVSWRVLWRLNTSSKWLARPSQLTERSAREELAYVRLHFPDHEAKLQKMTTIIDEIDA